MSFFFLLASWWLFIALISSVYFWAKKTDRSQAPIERRLMAFGYGLIWPVFAFKAVAGRQQKQAKHADQQAAHQRILGNAGSATPPTQPAPGTASPRMLNPFDTPQ